MATRTPPALMDELVEEILLRIPPDDPARLVRASVACKRWCRLVCDPGFRLRFRERHRTPPLLGVFRNFDGFARFVPACSFRPRRADRPGWNAIDCRHGRVLLRSMPWTPRPVLAVWDPVTDAQRELPALPWPPSFRFTRAAVLCAGRGGCNHLHCHRGPYLVVAVGIQIHSVGGAAVAAAFASMYSSEADAWGERTSTRHCGYFSRQLRSAHVRNALYFVYPWNKTTRILEYDLVTGEMTLIDPPPMDGDQTTITLEDDRIVLTTLESGELGCVTAKRSGLTSQLYLWSWEAGPDRYMRWAQRKLIEYKIPDGHRMLKLDVFGFADGAGVIYTGTALGAFTTDLKSGRSMKVGGVSGGEYVVPFMSFYTPALRVGL